jgi:uncharacterized protein (DUF433 family)
MENWRNRISIKPDVHNGDPCIAGTRVPVAVLVGSVADGDSIDQILTSWPQLAREDVQAALRFAAEAVSNFDVLPLS